MVTNYWQILQSFLNAKCIVNLNFTYITILWFFYLWYNMTVDRNSKENSKVCIPSGYPGDTKMESSSRKSVTLDGNGKLILRSSSLPCPSHRHYSVATDWFAFYSLTWQLHRRLVQRLLRMWGTATCTDRKSTFQVGQRTVFRGATSDVLVAIYGEAIAERVGPI